MHNGEEHKFDENKPALNLDLKKEQDTNLLNVKLIVLTVTFIVQIIMIII